MDNRSFKKVVKKNDCNQNEKNCMQKKPPDGENANKKHKGKGNQKVEREEKTIVVYGVIDEERMKELSRSIIGETLYPVNIDVIRER